MSEDQTESRMTQQAPYPYELFDLVASLTYKKDWDFRLKDIDRGQGSTGLTFIATVYGPDTYHPEEIRGVNHYFIVPAASYNRQSWQRWLFERLSEVELHETMEWFKVNGYRPFAPNHSPGHDPYTVRELTTDEDRRTDFRGVYHAPK